MTRNEILAYGVAAAAALAFLAAGAKRSPGGSVKAPAAAVEDATPFQAPPGAPVVGPEQHIGGVVLSPHRYPPTCGNDISVLIHRGLTAASLPGEDDMTWLSAPPGEGEL